jgi:hypothetical protein
VGEWRLDNTKWKHRHDSDVTQIAYDEMYRRLNERIPALLAKHGSMTEVIENHNLELLNYDDFAEIDQVVLAGINRKFQAGAEISALEEPDRYTL